MLNKNKKNLSSFEIKTIYINNSSKNKSKIKYNQDDSMLSKKSSKNETNLNALTYKKELKNKNQENKHDNINLYYKYLLKDKNNSIIKVYDKNNSAPNILHNNSLNINKKKFLYSYLKKINNEKKGIQLSNKNNFRLKKKDNNVGGVNNNINNCPKNNLKKMFINNSIATFNKNRKNINLSLNISTFGENISNETFQFEKLLEYKKFIDKQIARLIKEKKNNTYKNRNSDKGKKIIFPLKKKLYKTIYKSNSISDLGRNKRNIIKLKIYSRNNKNKSNDNLNLIKIPNRIKNFKHQLNKDSFSKNKLKKFVKDANIKGKIYLDSYNEMMNMRYIY